ncbi:MAG: tRNA uridine-5-carboxymethylaminomethyl(34) synthesis GTPase MnmE [Myxococcota bacterium]|nr:tRNA uridine-5-carboxymethylaminomethyl(34) synthesis GTPase MnmE [Myxococcota bacterium]
MIPRQDTIAAIATAAGGGIGVIRLSGPDAITIAGAHFTGLSTPIEPRRAYHGWWHDEAGSELDEGLLIVMPGPNSYTGEDVVEVQLHGGALGLERAVEVCYRAGARPAEPGEFTRRAFINGRMDLTRAEAIADLVDARTDRALETARSHLRGDLETSCLAMRERVLNLRARLEVQIDFVEEDVPVIDPTELATEAHAIAGELREIAGTFDEGRLWRQGARVVLAGPPNAGKSSLFNALCGHDRAIVTSAPGTTRDTLEATVDMLGIPVVLVDTAGLRDTTDPIEIEGVHRAQRAQDEADLILTLGDEGELHASPGRPRLDVASKSDLGHPCPEGAWAVSALTGEGLDDLVVAIVERLGGRAAGGGRLVITRARHQAALLRASGGLEAAAEGLFAGRPPELVAVDVSEATDALGELVGLTTIEDVLDRLFGAFCIGK